MPLNIKNRDVELLVGEVARLAGETKTEVVRKALLERRAVLVRRGQSDNRAARLRRFLENEVWPRVQQRKSLTRKEEEAILGFGPEGY